MFRQYRTKSDCKFGKYTCRTARRAAAANNKQTMLMQNRAKRDCTRTNSVELLAPFEKESNKNLIPERKE